MNDKNFELHTIGVQTISDNAILFIDDNTLVYGLSGNLIVYDIKDDTIIYKVFLSESMIKTISLLNIKNCVLVSSENATIFIVDYRIGSIVDKVNLRTINNVYSIDDKGNGGANHKYVIVSNEKVNEKNPQKVIVICSIVIVVIAVAFVIFKRNKGEK